MVDFPANKYYAEKVDKKSIVIHHTASDANPYGCINWWKQSPDHVSTPFIIAGKPSKNNAEYTDGQILQLYSSNFWAFHLGLSTKHLEAGGPNHSTNTILNKISIPIELCSWGPLTKKNDKFYSYDGEIVDSGLVTEYPNQFRGYNYYNSYTEAQLENLSELMKFLADKYAIKLVYDEKMWDIWPEALQNKQTLYTHCSVRPAPEKYDCHPQPELIEVLKNL